MIRAVLRKSAGSRAIWQAFAAAGACAFDDFVHVVDVLHFGMHRPFRADFAAQAARDAETFENFNFVHRSDSPRRHEEHEKQSKKPRSSELRVLRAFVVRKKFAVIHCVPPNARLGSGAQGRSKKSNTSSIGF